MREESLSTIIQGTKRLNKATKKPAISRAIPTNARGIALSIDVSGGTAKTTQPVTVKSTAMDKTIQRTFRRRRSSCS
ncbi:MAG: hypothetical protein PHZ02_10200 [Desulfocapsaceae bacterium]|nr:hypothetical protein [Desulfocapsaceae bacterium]